MELLKAIIGFIYLLELIALCIYYIVYYIEYTSCKQTTDYTHLEDIIITLTVSSCVIAIINGLNVMKEFYSLMRIYYRRELIQKDYRASFFGIQIILILFSTFHTIAFAILSILYDSLYFCFMKHLNWGVICTLDPHIVFDTIGYYLGTASLIVYIAFVMVLIRKLRSSCC